MILKILTWILVFYFLYCGGLFLLQRQIIFPRHHIVTSPEVAEKIPGLEKIWLEMNFGKVESWFLPSMIPLRQPVLIFAHGNAELIDHWAEVLIPLTRSGIGVYLVEYPGYGRSEGLPTQDSVVETFVTAYDHITGRSDVDPSRVIFMGRSLGGGAVCALVEKRKPQALILMSTFTSIKKMAKKFGAPGFFIRDPFDNLETVKNYGGPLLVIHGKYDEIVPYAHGMNLFKASAKGKLITYECGHNDCPPDWRVFFEDVTTFLNESGGKDGK